MATGLGVSARQLLPATQLPLHLGHGRAVSETVLVEQRGQNHIPAFQKHDESLVSRPVPVDASLAAKTTDQNLGAWYIISQEIADWQAVDRSKIRPRVLRPLPLLESSPNSPNVSQFSFKTVDSEDFTVGQRASTSDHEENLRLTALHLLSSTFTLPPDHIPGRLPSAFYYDGSLPFSLLPDPRLISSLRLHSYYLTSPAKGHHARDPSKIDPWPEAYQGPSREELLAEEMSHRRRIEILRLANSWELAGRTIRPSQASSRPPSLRPSVLEHDSPRFKNIGTISQISLHHLAVSSDDDSSMHRYPFSPSSLELLHAPPPSQTSLFTPSQCKSPSPIPFSPLQTQRITRARPLETFMTFQTSPENPYLLHTSSQPRVKTRWTFQSVEHSESHQLSLQPVKKLVARQWQSLRSRLWKSESRRASKASNYGVEMTRQDGKGRDTPPQESLPFRGESRPNITVLHDPDINSDRPVDQSHMIRKQPRSELPEMDGAESETGLSLIEALQSMPDPETWRVGPSDTRLGGKRQSRDKEIGL